MNAALWIVQGLVAVAMLAAGGMKLARPREELAERTPYVEDFTDGQIRAIGVLEVLAAVGLVLPGVTGIAPILVPMAASGVVLLMIGAIVVHVRRREYQAIAPNIVILALAAFVAWGRFGDYPL